MAGGGCGIVETMAVLKGLEDLIRDKVELPRSSGVQHLLYSMVLPGKECPQDLQGIKNWMRLYLMQCHQPSCLQA